MLAPLSCRLVSPASLTEHLQGPAERDILIINDVDGLCWPAQVDLALALTRQEIPVRSFWDSQLAKIGINDFTLIATAVNEGKLLRPFLKQFRLMLRFTRYSRREMEMILRQVSHRLGIDVSRAAIEYLAARSLGCPAAAVKLLESSVERSMVYGRQCVTRDNTRTVFATEGVSSLGSDRLKVVYLDQLKAHGNNTERTAMRNSLRWPARLVKEVESLLMDENKITVEDKRVHRKTAKEAPAPRASSPWPDIPF